MISHFPPVVLMQNPQIRSSSTMSISRTPIPSWTVKERAYVAFAVVAAALAASGVIRLGWIAYLAVRKNSTTAGEVIW